MGRIRTYQKKGVDRLDRLPYFWNVLLILTAIVFVGLYYWSSLYLHSTSVSSGAYAFWDTINTVSSYVLFFNVGAIVAKYSWDYINKRIRISKRKRRKH